MLNRPTLRAIVPAHVPRGRIYLGGSLLDAEDRVSVDVHNGGRMEEKWRKNEGRMEENFNVLLIPFIMIPELRNTLGDPETRSQGTIVSKDYDVKSIDKYKSHRKIFLNIGNVRVRRVLCSKTRKQYDSRISRLRFEARLYQERSFRHGFLPDRKSVV